jgi:hypothetical protein
MNQTVPLYRHKRPHAELLKRYYLYVRRHDFRVSALLSVAFLALGFTANLYAIHFASDHASNSVTDIILSNTPVFKVDGLFIYGTFVLFGFIAILCFAHPKRIPFVFNAIALFWIIRSVFTSLTHIAPFETHFASDFGATMTNAFFGGDLFFSGHTGTPFLLALIFWRETRLRYIFFLWSLYFAIIVLLGHLHYTIDVASAFFITYTIYHLALYLFPKSRALFVADDPKEAQPV